MTKPLRIAIAGLGTVGAGTVRMLADHAALLRQQCGRAVDVVAVSARDRHADRGIDISGARWCDNPLSLAGDTAVDVVVELIGGADGVALELCRAAITNGKHVVTANKAMLALHGTDLGASADDAGVSLAYEAAVAGGVPIVRALRESLAGNRLHRVYGILNGTGNYILSAMGEQGREFADVLAEAQQLGFAEADPSFDIDGVDAAHKLAILTSVAFACPANFEAVHIEGIREVSALDIAYAGELGYRIKLLGIARATPRGIEQRVNPCLVSLDAPIAHVDGVLNAVVAEGDFVDRNMFVGHGAGAGPTASAVVADLVDIARGRLLPAFGIPVAELRELPPSPIAERVGAYYVRLMVVDRPGAIADVAAALRDERISVEAMIQRGRSPEDVVPVVLTTHEAEEAPMCRALAAINRLDQVVEPPRMIRIEDF